MIFHLHLVCNHDHYKLIYRTQLLASLCWGGWASASHSVRIIRRCLHVLISNYYWSEGRPDKVWAYQRAKRVRFTFCVISISLQSLLRNKKRELGFLGSIYLSKQGAWMQIENTYTKKRALLSPSLASTTNTALLSRRAGNTNHMCGVFFCFFSFKERSKIQSTWNRSLNTREENVQGNPCDTEGAFFKKPTQTNQQQMISGWNTSYKPWFWQQLQAGPLTDLEKMVWIPSQPCSNGE